MSDSQVIALKANTQMNVGDLSLYLTFWNADLRLDTVSQPGGVFTFECTAWWRVYIYYVWLCLGSREYWLLDLTLRE